MVLSLRPSKVKVTTDMTLKTSKTGISNQQQANAPLKFNSHTRNTTKKQQHCPFWTILPT